MQSHRHVHSQAVHAEELLVLRKYDQAADAAINLLKTSHYSTEPDVQQSREQAATVLVQAFEEGGRARDTVQTLSKLYGSLLDIDLSAVLLWIALALQAGRQQEARAVLEQHIIACKDRLINAPKQKGERASTLLSNHQLVCKVYAHEMLAGDAKALQAFVQLHSASLDPETQSAILELQDPPADPTSSTPSASSPPPDHALAGTYSSSSPAARATAAQPAVRAPDVTESAAGPATPVSQEHSKQSMSIIRDGTSGSLDRPQSGLQAAAQQVEQQAVSSSVPAAALPPGSRDGRQSSLPQSSPEVESSYASWTIPIATACAGVMAYAAFHERRALTRGGNRLMQAATTGLGDAFSAGMRVTPNPSGARAMYSRL